MRVRWTMPTRGEETVLDLYCGAGTITLALAAHAKHAVGVEIVPEAIENAKNNARRNGAENVEFYCADAGQAAGRFNPALILLVVDPPLQRSEPKPRPTRS